MLALACGKSNTALCEKDEQCAVNGKKAVCVQGACVACRADDTCDVGQACISGECKAIAGYCDASHPCPSGECRANRCVEAPAAASRDPMQCDEEHPCSGPGERCENNHCVAPVKGGPGCEAFPAPQFAFESQELPATAKATLDRLAKCLTTGGLKGHRVLLTGHCDSRGETEFNLSLGANRAETVRSFLVTLGVPSDKVATSSRGELDARGFDEPTWAEDRRVDLEVR
jgi:peptidoglycan-associated lipoprotein